MEDYRLTQAGIIEELIASHSVGLENPITQSSHPPCKSIVVLLTGSTGNLGTEILACLLENDTVERVYAYNRPCLGGRTILQRHEARFADRGLDIPLLNSRKLVFIEGHTSVPYLGLTSEVYRELSDSLTLIIHNAWTLNLSAPLSKFESCIQGTRALVDLALASHHAASLRFIFISSLASAQSWDQRKGLLPAEIVNDARVAVGSGYGESKYITERILAKSGLRVSSLRVGQICGSVRNGAWPTTELIPTLIKSCLGLGAIPDSKGLASWIPMDMVAVAVVELALNERAPPIAVNVAHPRPIYFREIMCFVRDALIRLQHLKADALPFVSSQDWLILLQKHAAEEADAEKLPAIKLLKFFRGIARLEAEREIVEIGGPSLDIHSTEKMSLTIKRLRPIAKEDADLWVRYWMGVKYL